MGIKMKRKIILCVIGTMALILGGCRGEGDKDEDRKVSQSETSSVASQVNSKEEAYGNESGNAKQTSDVLQSSSQLQTTQNNKMITNEEAKAKALSHAKLDADKVTFVQCKLEHEDGREVYDVEFYSHDRGEYDYDIDAYTGEVVSYDYDAEHYEHKQHTSANNNNVITEEEAKKMALKRVQGADKSHIREFEKDYDDGRVEYEGKIIYNGVEYEFEIDGSNGTFIDWEEEPAD